MKHKLRICYNLFKNSYKYGYLLQFHRNENILIYRLFYLQMEFDFFALKKEEA